MTSLRDMQRMVRDAVFEKPATGPALEAISERINASAGMNSAEHLRIYRRAILGTLVAALGNIYPVCKRLVGDPFFDGMARLYARETPSQSADLAHYGGDFAKFIASFEPAAGIVYLPDVARLEWHWHSAFNAADEIAAMDAAALGEIPEADLGRVVFRLPVSASLVISEYPVHRIWQVNQDDWEGSQAVDLDEGGVRLIVWRQQYDMRIDKLDEPAWQFLNAIADRVPFIELSEFVAGAPLEALLPRCIQSGWVAGFDPTGPISRPD